jgi:hypothetical protein
MVYGTNIYRESFNLGANQTVTLRVSTMFTSEGFKGIQCTQLDTERKTVRKNSVRSAGGDSMLRQMWMTTQGN